MHTSVEYSKKVIQNILIPECTYAIILKETNILIGNIGLQGKKQSNLSIGDNEAEIGYWIGTEHRGMGFAPEAVNGIIRHELKSGELKAIWAGCFEGNKNSMRVLEKCGFEFVRTEKDKYWPLLDGYHTTHIMKISIG